MPILVVRLTDLQLGLDVKCFSLAFGTAAAAGAGGFL